MKRARLLIVVSLVTLILGCATIDSKAVRARAGAPESARVDRLEIPYDSTLPRFALMIQTFVKEGPVSETTINTHDQAEVNGSITTGTNRSSSEREHDTDSVHTVKAKIQKLPEQAANPKQVPTGKSTSPKSPLKQVAGGTNTKGGSEEKTQGLLEREDYNAIQERTSSGSTSSKVKTGIDMSAHHDSNYQRRDRSWEVSRRDINIAAQFTSSLAGVQNFLVLDPAAVVARGRGIHTATLPPGVSGPFIVKAIVSEEVYEVEGSRRKLILPGIVATKTSSVQGVVVMDITVIDGRTGAIVAAFPTEGTFSSQDKRFSAGILLPFSEQHAFARSVISQAQRVALNQAAREIFDTLSSKSLLH